MMFDAPLKLTEDGQVTFDFPEKPKPVETNVVCPKCQKKLMRAQWNYECECGFKVSHTVAKVELSEEIMKELLETGKTKDKVIGFTSKAGNIFDACLKFEDDRISFDFDNPGSGSGGTGASSGEERPFYEELDSKPITVDISAENGNRNTDDDSAFDMLNIQEDAQYIDDDVPAFYDAMAEEFAVYDEQDIQEQELADQLLGDAFLLNEEQ